MRQRIVVHQLALMPALWKWVVDFVLYESEEVYSYDLHRARYFDEEKKALSLARDLAREEGYERLNSHTWVKKD